MSWPWLTVNVTVCTHTHTCINVWIHTYTHICILSYNLTVTRHSLLTDTHVCIYINTYTYTHMHTYCQRVACDSHHSLHTDTHTYIYIHTFKYIYIRHTRITSNELTVTRVTVYSATYCNTLQHTLQRIAVHCTTLQHAASHCNTLHQTTRWPQLASQSTDTYVGREREREGCL